MVKYERRLTVTFEGDDALCMVNLFRHHYVTVFDALFRMNQGYSLAIKDIFKRVAEELDVLGVK